MIFFLETVISGLMAGVMYALVAIGFVLIFKASGVFNYAQGVMALFAALTLVGVMEKFGVSAWIAIPVTMGVMIIVAYLVDYFILRHLVNEPPIILFMATIGLAYVLE
ncbi:MAG: branched-chain amino acid ABC transporter permease, partial [Rhodospirillales bacterium]